MFVRNFAPLFAGTALGSKLMQGKATMAMAACIVCVAGNGHAATSRIAAFSTMPFVSPVAPASVKTSSSITFNDRFNVPQASLMRDYFARLTYHVPEAPITTASLPPNQKPRTQQKIVAASRTIVGIASTYDPNDPADLDAGNQETASGERYDPLGWTAAIRTDLRKKFGGVRYGKNYVPTFALVQANDKRLIVKINDVGPLKRGRIIDLNKRAMRYFDPTLELGLINNVRVTPLVGQDLALGPVGDNRPVSIASNAKR